GLDHLGRRVAGVEDRESRGEIDQPVAVDVLHDRAGGALREYRHSVEDGRRNGGKTAFGELPGPRAGDLRAQPPLLRRVTSTPPTRHGVESRGTGYFGKGLPCLASRR